MAVNRNKWLKLHTRMAEVQIREEDLEEQFVQGSGKGGQKINKTASCVVLKHLPSQTVIKCQRSRSRELNRLHAREELCSRIENERAAAHEEVRHARAKKRRQNRKPTKKEKEAMATIKKRRSEKKQLRKPPKTD